MNAQCGDLAVVGKDPQIPLWTPPLSYMRIIQRLKTACLETPYLLSLDQCLQCVDCPGRQISSFPVEALAPGVVWVVNHVPLSGRWSW